MTIYNDLFPTEQRLEYVQTQWSEGWGYAAIGFGEAASFLTRERAKFGASIDQVGLAVFFLQRHRTELILKGLLDDLDLDVPVSHSLRVLWDACKSEIQPLWPSGWATFEQDHEEFIMALDRVDPGSFSFRYPEDKQGKKVERPSFINLEVLDQHVESLHFGAGGFVDYLFAGRDEAS